MESVQKRLTISKTDKEKRGGGGEKEKQKEAHLGRAGSSANIYGGSICRIATENGPIDPSGRSGDRNVPPVITYNLR